MKLSQNGQTLSKIFLLFFSIWASVCPSARLLGNPFGSANRSQNFFFAFSAAAASAAEEAADVRFGVTRLGDDMIATPEKCLSKQTLKK